MATIDYKQKIKDYMNSSEVDTLYKSMLNNLFPELKESEDERIRKELIDYLKERKSGESYGQYIIRYERWISWLEEQGEQKSADKVEPKFHEGEWVVYECGEETATLQITRIVGETYVFSDDSTLGVVDEDTLRLWDITKDAKDGDVLVASDGSIFLFKGTIDWGCKHYVALTTDGAVKFNEGLKHFWETSTAVHPATKEQRDLLFQKMKEAGYEWDAEKKELKKIESITTWSEEDEKAINDIMWIIEAYRKNGFNKTHIQMADSSENWLKSLKDRVQPKQEWSEEDEQMLNHVVYDIESLKEHVYCIALCDEEITWLKSLKNRYTWKPSDEQMERLKGTINSLPHQEVLYSLYQDLLKLREE